MDSTRKAKTVYTIRTAEAHEVETFSLYNEQNAGDEIKVAVATDGAIAAFVQHDGAYIYFVESVGQGAGTALVDALKADYSELYARNVSREAAGYWIKQGFEDDGATGERPGERHFVWYAE